MSPAAAIAARPGETPHSYVILPTRELILTKVAAWLSTSHGLPSDEWRPQSSLLPRCDLLVSAVAAELEIDRPPGMPAHVTLLYPFVDESTLVAGMAAQAQRALSLIAPFECEFASFGRFIDPIPTALYLEPNPPTRSGQ